MFQNRKVIIATKHGKERVIAPVLEQALGVSCFIDEAYDTDVMGTFTGEIERALDPISTVREKCLRAMQLNNCDLGVASEGSFGPHPSLYFISADDEFLIFIDKKHNLEIIVRELSTETNFNGREVKDSESLLDFARAVGFPEHGLILRRTKDDPSEIYKGIADFEALQARFELLHSKYQTAYVETDMRALYNPTRMKVIERAAEKLAQKILSTCPQCQMPGFGITEARTGLACSLCGLPTNGIISYVYVCRHCAFAKEEMYPHNKQTEDPRYCDYCNP